MAKMLIGGQEITLTDKELIRMRKKASRHEFGFEQLESGIIVNLNEVTAIIPESWDIANAPIVQHGAPYDAEIVETFGEMPVHGETQDDEPGFRVSGPQVEMLIEKTGLNKAAFAATVGFSPATVHMAIKEGRVSQEFSDAIKAKYASMLDISE